MHVVPANTSHYLWARDGEVVYREAGIAPTATIPVGSDPGSGLMRMPVSPDPP
jgi:hypothetical protein